MKAYRLTSCTLACKVVSDSSDDQLMPVAIICLDSSVMPTCIVVLIVAPLLY